MWPTCNKTFPVAARYPKYIANSSVTRKLYRRTRSRKSARASSNNTCQRLALTALIARPPPRPRAAVKCNSNTRPPATAPPTQRRDPAAAPPLLEPARHLRAARFRKFETVAEWPAIQRSESPIPTPGLPRRAAISPARHAPAGVLRPKSRYPSRSLPRRKQCASKESQCARRKVPKANCEIARALPDPIPLLARPQSAAPDRSAALAQFPRAVSCRRKIRPAHGHAPRPDSPRRRRIQSFRSGQIFQEFPRRQMRIHTEILRQISQHAAQRIRRSRDVHVIPQHTSFSRARHRSQNPHQRGFSRSVWSQQSHHARAHLHPQIAQPPQLSRILLARALYHQFHQRLAPPKCTTNARAARLAQCIKWFSIPTPERNDWVESIRTNDASHGKVSSSPAKSLIIRNFQPAADSDSLDNLGPDRSSYLSWNEHPANRGAQ